MYFIQHCTASSAAPRILRCSGMLPCGLNLPVADKKSYEEQISTDNYEENGKNR
jgi:hypothetical protein